MNMKKISKIISVLMLVMMIAMITTNVFATSTIDQLKGGSNIDSTKIVNFGNNLITILQIVGSVVAVVILMIIGIKYLMGSAEEKAEYKKTMIPYIVGAILVFAAPFIAGIVYNFANGLNG